MIKRILVIDDDEAIRKLFVLTLEDTDYPVDTAESGIKGLEFAGRTDYNLIFLDLKMPEMNGIETLRRLRKIDNDVPVYIITAFHREFFEDLKKLKNDRIDFELLQKPFDRHQLLSVTEAILGE